MSINPNHVPRAPVPPHRRSKWESLAEIDRRFGRRSAELREAREAQIAHATEPAPIPQDVDVVTGTTAPEDAPLSAWWGVALAAVAAACALAFSIVAQ